MHAQQWMIRAALASGVAVLAAALVPAGGSAAQASYQPAAPAAFASYLQQPSEAPWSSSTGGGSGRNHLPTSVMPNGIIGLRCSVDPSDIGTPPTCSTATTGIQCSAHCDNLQFCSAFPFAAGTAAACSTLGGSQLRCSVLQPNINFAGPSMCSVFGDATGVAVNCSVLGNGFKQGCSAQNGATVAGNQCSTNNLTGLTGGVMRCSVLGGGPTIRKRCSVADPVLAGQVPKQCSVFIAASSCSVRAPNRSFCTNFLPAPAGTCSAFVAGSTCSVINGTSGSFCKWP
ncbi:MAG: hypothetical protein EYC70_07395 [Planctomycetota bacterium]|nr:MAG: hypothetical protein EYC70_07395 [Planctomycetota bacterium]